MKKKPYSKRTDIEKIRSNWKKTKGLLKRKEYSGAIVRAVTAAEIASNFLIREELQNKRKIEEHFVDNLLIWANGIQGKFDKIILPLFKTNTLKHKRFKEIKSKVENINKQRNYIVHSGQFKNKKISIVLLKESKNIIEALIKEYQKNFELETI